MSGEFKPCPFCGSENLALGYEGQPARSFFVICTDCKAQGPAWVNVQGGECDAFPLWDGRKRESELEKGYERRIARLREFADLDQCDGTCDEVKTLYSQLDPEDDLPSIEGAITAVYGEKCPEYDPDCLLCQVWAELESLREVSCQKVKSDLCDQLAEGTSEGILLVSVLVSLYNDLKDMHDDCPMTPDEACMACYCQRKIYDVLEKVGKVSELGEK